LINLNFIFITYLT